MRGCIFCVNVHFSFICAAILALYTGLRHIFEPQTAIFPGALLLYFISLGNGFSTLSVVALCFTAHSNYYLLCVSAHAGVAQLKLLYMALSRFNKLCTPFFVQPFLNLLQVSMNFLGPLFCASLI